MIDTYETISSNSGGSTMGANGGHGPPKLSIIFFIPNNFFYTLEL